MEQLRGRRLSPALAISIVALVLAGSGTAFGSGAVAFIAKAVGLSSKQKKQVTSIADRQISAKAPALSVLNATNATNATHAATATNATNATNATHAATATSASTATSATNAANAANAANATNAANAANATDLGGEPASAFEPSADTVRSGLITLAEGGTETFVASFGPFTLKLGCTSGTASELYVTSSSSSSTAFVTGLGGPSPTTLSAGGTNGFLGGGSGSLQINTAIVTFVTGTSEYIADLTVGQDLPAGAANTCFANAVVNVS